MGMLLNITSKLVNLTNNSRPMKRFNKLPTKIRIPDSIIKKRNFKTHSSEIDTNEGKQMTLSFHLNELKERSLLSVITIAVALLLSFSISKEILNAIEVAGLDNGFSFIQLSPGEYFFTSLEVSLYSTLAISFPTSLYHFITYILPGLTNTEKNLYVPILLLSCILFYSGVLFSFYVISPITFKFFSSYSYESVESTLSIKEYFEFYSKLLISTGLSFQIPIVQIFLIKSGFLDSKTMLSKWRYVVVLSTILSAIITPSTDPITQLVTCLPLILLYFL